MGLFVSLVGTFTSFGGLGAGHSEPCLEMVVGTSKVGEALAYGK